MKRFGIVAALLCFALSGCASINAGPNASVQQRVAAARSDLNTAGLFVDLYAAFPQCGATVAQPCSNREIVALLNRGRVVASAALDAVDALIAAGSTEDKILAALIAAEDAVRVLQNWKANTAAFARPVVLPAT